MSKAELREVYDNLPTVDKDGREIEFYRSAFKKIYKDGGLFGQVVPVLHEVLEQSVLAYSETDNLNGTERPDGTIHKEHINVLSFENYVGKVRLNGKDYFVRTTVQRERTISGTHSFFVSNVDVYENPTESRTIPITSRGTTNFDGIIDAKLQQFFERASSEALELDKKDRVNELSEKLGVSVKIISDKEDIDNLPSARHRRSKGWWSEDNGVVVVLPNNVNVADVDNTVVHEVVGHKGLRALIGAERFDDFLGEVYSHASNPIRKVIDKMTNDMVSAEADRLRVRKSVAHERAGEDVNSHYYTDMAEARIEAEQKREQFRKEATEEYMADLGGRIGSEGFAQMSRDELTLWGKIKAKVQQFLDKFLQGLKIARSIRLTDKDLSYILYKSWKNLRKKGVFYEAEDAVRRRQSGYDDMMTVSEKYARIEKLRKSTPVEISGKEIEYSPDIKVFKKNALEYGKKLQGKYINEDTGKTIQLQRGRHNGGLKEVLQHDLFEKAHIQSIAAIPAIITKSIYIETRPNMDLTKNPDVTGYEHYVCGLRIGEEDYTVHSIVASDKAGNRYYDHKLSHIEKGRLLDFIEAKQPIEQILTPMSGTEPTIRSQRKVKELILLLQIEDEGMSQRFRGKIPIRSATAFSSLLLRGRPRAEGAEQALR